MSNYPVNYTTECKCRLKKLISSGNSTLTTINPDVFAVNPRPGGYVKVTPSASDNTLNLRSRSLSRSGSQTSISVYYSSSRERRINQALEGSNWNVGENKIDLESAGTLAENMLAVTISCVMLMAAKAQKIPEEYITYAERYLSCIKDDRDVHPPNVQGILNHIQYLRAKMKNKQKQKAKSESCECFERSDSEASEETAASKKSVKKRSNSKVKIKAPDKKK